MTWMDEEWAVEAMCRQADPEVMFPEKGGSTAPAKMVCAACSVRRQCLGEALVRDERFGIWGGLSERERRKLNGVVPDIHPAWERSDRRFAAAERRRAKAKADGDLSVAQELRAAAGMHSNRDANNEQRMTLYNDGAIDQEMAFAAGVTVNTIVAWRKRRKLPPNLRKDYAS